MLIHDLFLFKKYGLNREMYRINLGHLVIPETKDAVVFKGLGASLSSIKKSNHSGLKPSNLLKCIGS